jgi:hypothetical protein
MTTFLIIVGLVGRCPLDHVVESTPTSEVSLTAFSAPALRIALAKVCPEEFAIVIFVVLMMGIAIHRRWRGRAF